MMIADARHKRYLLALPDVPPFEKQTDEVRPVCQCGRKMRAVSAPPWVTWYGPATCPRCGNPHGLRAILRRIDPQFLREHRIRNEAHYRSLLREKAEILEAQARRRLRN